MVCSVCRVFLDTAALTLAALYTLQLKPDKYIFIFHRLTANLFCRSKKAAYPEKSQCFLLPY